MPGADRGQQHACRERRKGADLKMPHLELDRVLGDLSHALGRGKGLPGLYDHFPSDRRGNDACCRSLQQRYAEFPLEKADLPLS